MSVCPGEDFHLSDNAIVGVDKPRTEVLVRIDHAAQQILLRVVVERHRSARLRGTCNVRTRTSPNQSTSMTSRCLGSLLAMALWFSVWLAVGLDMASPEPKALQLAMSVKTFSASNGDRAVVVDETGQLLDAPMVCRCISRLFAILRKRAVSFTSYADIYPSESLCNSMCCRIPSIPRTTRRSSAWSPFIGENLHDAVHVVKRPNWQRGSRHMLYASMKHPKDSPISLGWTG